MSTLASGVQPGIPRCVHATSHSRALPVSMSRVQGSSSTHVVRQALPGGSQVSGGVQMPSPQREAQSESVDTLQVVVDGQQESPLMHCVILMGGQARLQVAALPVLMWVVQGSESVQLGQGTSGGSQVSPGSRRPLPQPAQSLSFIAVQPRPLGQQPSPDVQLVIGDSTQAKLHVDALPVELTIVQELGARQVVGHELGGSHVSSPSTRPLPQPWQSLSLAPVHCGPGQQPSPLMHSVIIWTVHAKLHIAALPMVPLIVQAFVSVQVEAAGQFPSHVSGRSTTLLPQLGEQSLSLEALQLRGQQSSPFPQEMMFWCVQAVVQLALLPVRPSTVQATPSLQLIAAHALGGSQVSPRSTTPFPQVAEQLLSLLASQPPGQQPSPLAQVEMVCRAHATLQLRALPVIMSIVHEFPSLHVVGQVLCGSHVSPGSSAPLPQLAEQSLSLLALQPGGQQPSPRRHWVIVWRVQAEVQLSALPVSMSTVQALPSLHAKRFTAQVRIGSHVSPLSITPLPQLTLQSLSLLLLQPGGQQRSPDRHCVMVRCVQAALQVAACPISVSMVQALPSSQLVGHVLGGSQVSPCSIAPFMQLTLQSRSLLALQPLGQQPSPARHCVIC